MCVKLSKYLNIMYAVNSDEADKKSRSLLRWTCCAGNELRNIFESKIIGHDIHLMLGENGRICVPVQCKCQVDKKKKRVGGEQTDNFLLC